MRVVSMICGLVAASAGLIGCGPISFTVGSDVGSQPLAATPVTSDGGFFSDQVAMIDVTGLIININRNGILTRGENPVAALQERLEKARKDDRVKAVIIRLNTPGGTVAATEAMYREIERFKERSSKPVIALMTDVAASGGFYLACAADHIVAQPTTITGSIGVIMQLVSVKPLMDRWGIEATALTSGPNKAAGSPLSRLTDEQRATLQAIVDQFYSEFTAVVRRGRPNIPADRFAEVTDGRVFTGTEAARLGLVDQTGDLYDAFAAAKRAAGLQRAELVLYHRQGRVVRSPYQHGDATTPPGGVQVNLAQINLADTVADGTSTFLYLWQPGQ